MLSYCVDVWNPDHESLVTRFFDGYDQKHDHELGNGLLFYYHQLMHDVLVQKLPQRFAVRHKDVRDDIEKLTHELNNKMRFLGFNEVNRRVNRFEGEMNELCFDGKSDKSGKHLSFNEDLCFRAAQVQAMDWTLVEKYGRLHLSEIWQCASDIANVLQGPPPNVSKDDWDELMRTKTELRNAAKTVNTETLEKYMEILERHDALAARINFYECKLKIPRMKPKDLRDAVENLSQSALSADMWEKNLDVVKGAYPLLRECHAQLPYVFELLKSGKLVEMAYEQLLKLVRDCLKKGERCLRQKHSLFFREVLEYLGMFGGQEDHIYQFLESLSSEDRDKQYQASQETRRFYDFLSLHEPNQYTQKRVYHRCSVYQAHICEYYFSCL